MISWMFITSGLGSTPTDADKPHEHDDARERDWR